MIWVVRDLISKSTALAYRWSLRQALTLPPRGGLRKDGLKLKRAVNRLELEWNARDIHPWDQDDPDDTKARNFLGQFLADAETAIDRIFKALPQIDQIHITVRDPASDQVIASGTLDRICPEMDRASSPRMRLLARGLICNLNAAYFDRLPRADPAIVGR